MRVRVWLCVCVCVRVILVRSVQNAIARYACVCMCGFVDVFVCVLRCDFAYVFFCVFVHAHLYGRNIDATVVGRACMCMMVHRKT